MTGIGQCSRLDLSEEESFALLNLCLASPGRLDFASEQALKKLALFCKSGFALVGEQHTSSKRELAEPS